MNVIGVIPARYASTRFPGKPLAQICGRPMIYWVYKGASESKLLSDVIVATDDDRIADACRAFGAHVEMTGENHASGTDRLGEIAEKIEADYYVNIQGDEPLIKGYALDSLIETVTEETAPMGTLAFKCDDVERVREPGTVKVVMDAAGYALYFSRFPVPFPRNIEATIYYVHVGIYIYSRETLLQICRLPRTTLEKAESLEQLRALENGIRIKVVKTNYQPVGVDTPDDLIRAEAVIRKSN